MPKIHQIKTQTFTTNVPTRNPIALKKRQSIHQTNLATQLYYVTNKHDIQNKLN